MKLLQWLCFAVLLPINVAVACTNDCDCNLGGKCFYLPNVSEGICVNTPIKAHHVYDDYHHLCVVFDEIRDVSLSDLAKLEELTLKSQLVIHSRESFKTLTHRRCACPYDTNSLGQECGPNSAYHRNGTLSPLCYQEDIDKRHIHQFKGRSTDFFIDQALDN